MAVTYNLGASCFRSNRVIPQNQSAIGPASSSTLSASTTIHKDDPLRFFEQFYFFNHTMKVADSQFVPIMTHSSESKYYQKDLANAINGDFAHQSLTLARLIVRKKQTEPTMRSLDHPPRGR